MRQVFPSTVPDVQVIQIRLLLFPTYLELFRSIQGTKVGVFQIYLSSALELLKPFDVLQSPFVEAVIHSARSPCTQADLLFTLDYPTP